MQDILLGLYTLAFQDVISVRKATYSLPEDLSVNLLLVDFIVLWWIASKYAVLAEPGIPNKKTYCHLQQTTFDSSALKTEQSNLRVIL